MQRRTLTFKALQSKQIQKQCDRRVPGSKKHYENFITLNKRCDRLLFLAPKIWLFSGKIWKKAVQISTSGADAISDQILRTWARKTVPEWSQVYIEKRQVNLKRWNSFKKTQKEHWVIKQLHPQHFFQELQNTIKSEWFQMKGY